MAYKIDINCDVGEGMGNEAQLFPIISSCNIACGGHAGDEASIRQISRMAQKHHVKVGVHPSYPDKDNFGRKKMAISDQALSESIQQQLDLFSNILKEEKINLNHIKPHGALYNAISKEGHLAQVFLNAISEYREEVFLYVPYQSKIADEAKKAGYKIRYEVFCDRNYNPDVSLVSRESPNALLADPVSVLNHTLYIIKHDKVKTMNGEAVEIKADTFCLHGDTPSAIKILTYLSQELPKNNVKICK